MITDEQLAALEPPTVEQGAGIEAATGCSVAELLALPQPPFDVLAQLLQPLLPDPPVPVPALANWLAQSGTPAVEWGALLRAAFAVKEDSDDE